MKRRSFLKGAAALAALSRSGGAAAADRINVGIMGVGGRGRGLLASLAKRRDVRVKYICDVDPGTFEPAGKIVSGYKPEFVKDFRRILDDPDVDALINATSDRWHALGTIMACQAGKDVYVEKPLSLCVWDGRKMVEAARKYERVVQVGTQTRSAPYTDRAVEYIRNGGLGEVRLALVYLMQRGHRMNVAEERPVPDGFDWELWCGPSPMMPYRPGQWFQRLWSYYTGYITADLIHQMDLTRLLIGAVAPDSAVSAGGVYHFDDGREQPDTHFVTYEFGNTTLLSEGSVWSPYNHRIVHLPKEVKFPDWLFSATNIELCGTERVMFFGRHGGGWQVFEGDEGARASRPVVSDASEYKFGTIVDRHFDDFFSCMHTRKTPKADVEEVHLSMNLCHLGNISYRVGNRKLKWDGEEERFIGDAEADRYLKCEYRKPWVVPEEV